MEFVSKEFTVLNSWEHTNLTTSPDQPIPQLKAQQRLHFLQVLKKNNLCRKLLVTFYRSAIQSTLTYCLTVWHAGCSAADKKALQRVVNTAQKITGCPLPSLQDISNTRYLSRAKQIVSDCSHPDHFLFDLLPSGRCFRSIKARTSRYINSFYPKAVHTLNQHT